MNWKHLLKNLAYSNLLLPYTLGHILDIATGGVLYKKGVLHKKGVLKNFTKFIEKQLCLSFFF